MASTAILERAFELARSGDCATIEQIRRALVRERFEDVDQHLSGPLIRNQLRKSLVEARMVGPVAVQSSAAAAS